MIIKPITLRAASVFIKQWHRHHTPPRGCAFAVSVVDDSGKLRGVAVAGRPVARCFDDGVTLEVTRVCTDGQHNACSKLYGAVYRIARELGYELLVTYTLRSELGVSLRASGFALAAVVRGRTWDCPSRRRVDKHPTVEKIRWERRIA